MKKNLTIAIFIVSQIIAPGYLAAADNLKVDFSGYLKSLNIVTKSSGAAPETASNPLLRVEPNEYLFENIDRWRLESRLSTPKKNPVRWSAKLVYDLEGNFGSFVSRGDYRIAQQQVEGRQAVDLSGGLLEEKSAVVTNRIYRGSILLDTDQFSVETGRQQIPWGVCQFFTPTDVFNPYSATQIELDERDGVDAVNGVVKNVGGVKIQGVFTPRGRRLHPQRYLARFSREINSFDVGALGGLVGRDGVGGLDLAGNIKDSVLRSEILVRHTDFGRTFAKFTINADYNFPGNIYALAEYHFNGEGNSGADGYEYDRLIRGEIQQLARHYLALMIGKDINPLLRTEVRMIYNLNDSSFFFRPELRYEIKTDLLLTLASQHYLGGAGSEFGSPKDLYLGEIKYSY